MFEGVLGTKLYMYDSALITIVGYTFLINSLLICARSLKHLFLLNNHSKSVYVIGHVFLIFFIDLSITDNFQDYICQIRCFFFLPHLDCQYQSRIVFAGVSKKIFLKSYFNDLFWDLEIFVFVDQAENCVKSDLVMAGIIDDIFTV